MGLCISVSLLKMLAFLIGNPCSRCQEESIKKIKGDIINPNHHNLKFTVAQCLRKFSSLKFLGSFIAWGEIDGNFAAHTGGDDSIINWIYQSHTQGVN